MKKMSRPTANHNGLKLLVLIAHLTQIRRSKYTNSAVVITGWFTVTKYPHIKCQWILSLGLIKNGQSREIDNIRHVRHMTKTKTKINITQKTKKMSNTDPTKVFWQLF
jgi:hypothetical protein